MSLKPWKAILWSSNRRYKIAETKIKASERSVALNIAKAIYYQAGMTSSIEVKKVLF
jgi:hypothetical protein